MALLKAIELDNGVILNYHRIASINKITNHTTVLAVVSYTSKTQREKEIQQMASQEMITAYTETDYINVDYDEKTTIKDWYTYLKTTEKYSGAEDDEDEDNSSTTEASDGAE